MRGFPHFSINDSIYPIYIQQELNIGPTIHMTVIAVWISLICVDRHHERQKMTWPPLAYCEQVSYIVFLGFYSSWRPKSFRIKAAWSNISMVYPQKSKILLRPFSTCVLTGAPISTKRAHRDPTFVVQSTSPLEMACTVDLYNLCFSFVEALVSTIDGTWYEHMFRNIVSVPPIEVDICSLLPWIILSRFIFLRMCCVRKHPCLL